jgi:ribosomal protein S18 acetylase RimI-like enzyme
MRLRVMKKFDIPASVRLNQLAGWNQTAADWHHFLDASPDGCFVAEEESRICGTATTITYENRFAWIGMVLVDPEFQKRGIGTRLLNKTIEYLDERKIPTLKLDATPQGQPLYAKLGFVCEYQIERWMLKRQLNTAPGTFHSSHTRTEGQLNLLDKFDREVFGADRRFLLNSLRQSYPSLATSIWGDELLQGYTLGRSGLFADHLGPWVASTQAVGERLLMEFLTRSSRETVLVDCLSSNSAAIELLRSHGFTRSRLLTRMFRGPNAYPGNLESLFAIVGPEFG